ncbi:hypothetical protein [Lysobacter gummosus]
MLLLPDYASTLRRGEAIVMARCGEARTHVHSRSHATAHARLRDNCIDA